MNMICGVAETVVTREWNKVNGVPIQIYDEDTDNFVTFGPGHQDMGDTYYILNTSAHVICSPAGFVVEYLWTKRKFVNEGQIEEDGTVLLYDGHAYFKNHQSDVELNVGVFQ